MAKVLILDACGVKTFSDELTSTSADIIKGLTAVTKDSNDEIVIGTMDDYGSGTVSDSVASASNGIAIRLKSGAYRQNGNDGGTVEIHTPYNEEFNTAIGMNTSKILKGTTIAGQSGTLEPQSIVNFNLSLYASETVMGAWQNPSKGPYSGVRIVFRTDRYPNSPTDGEVIYEGNGISFTHWLQPDVRVYFSAFSYITTNYGRFYNESPSKTEFTSTRLQGRQTFTSNGVFTVPEGVRSVQVFLVGGGGGGAYTYGGGMRIYYGSGGGGGYTKTETVSVTPGQQITVVVGNGGPGGTSTNGNGQSGGSSGFGNIWIGGGQPAVSSSSNDPGNGGSGGGRGARRDSDADYVGGNGGADGSDGEACSKSTNGQASPYYKGGVGQHTTTREFGEAGATLYAGGGAGGGNDWGHTYYGYPGAGGGGSVSSNGTTNTGGGGGGAYKTSGNGGNGGSGIVIVRWGY